MKAISEIEPLIWLIVFAVVDKKIISKNSEKEIKFQELKGKIYVVDCGLLEYADLVITSVSSESLSIS